uniref:Kinesin-like protein n=1 Tax=Anthurium amnicola TaxID=1678845 RepID=A0A1D1YB82_9ARAE
MAADEALLLLLPPPAAALLPTTHRGSEEGVGDGSAPFHGAPCDPEPVRDGEAPDATLEARRVVEGGNTVPVPEERTLADLTISEERPSEDNPLDGDEGPAIHHEIDNLSSLIQTLENNSAISQAMLDGILKGSFPAPDLSSSLHHLGTKYNNLMKEFEECSLRMKGLEEYVPKYEALTKKYMEEWAERKRLYNEVIELKGNIRVFCRCRPLSWDEISKGYSSIFEFDPSQDAELQIITPENSRKLFKFDHVFGPQDSQEAVFAETMPIVKSVMDGFNACIFAYGQTGTGKTFTMEGTPENRGVNYRTLEELFRISEERSSVMRFEFFVSILEVYNEKIRDLLGENPNQSAKRLEVKQAAEGTQEVPGLVEAQACSIDGVWELLKTGSRNRSVGSTNANEISSRSHSLVRITTKGENLVNGLRSRSHLWLVDLAGSERVGKIEVEGERLKESQFINKSLSALGDVIAALASKNPHIPYRNSKLTHLLQSSLGGDCKTLMFVQISPCSADVGETICSLNFATRVRGIEQGPARKHSDPTEAFQYKQMAEKLRQEQKERARLNESLQLMHIKYSSRENVFKTLQEKVKDQVKDLENQLAEERKTRLQQEAKDSTRYHKPPLPPIKERQPLGRISSNLPPSAHRRSMVATTSAATEDKENISLWRRRPDNPGPIKPLMKARRILLAPVVRPTSTQQPRRRASIAVMSCAGGEARVRQNNSSCQNSVLKIPRRRLSLALALPSTPVAATPESKAATPRSSTASASKFFSPPQMQQAMWRSSRIPAFASPRQRLRFVSSPTDRSRIPTSMQAANNNNKLCFSIQKRLVISSPGNNKPLRDKEFVGRAQRILLKNRRRSVM